MKTPETRPERRPEENASEDRIVLLCDGVFAIAITLLVLDIRLPDKLAAADIKQALQDLLARTIMYLITFAVLAIYWFNHRRMMKYIRRVDAGFIWLNLLFLAFIAYFPVTSSAVGQHSELSQIVILYVLVLSGCGYASVLPWLYATQKRRLVDPDLDQYMVNYQILNILIAPTFYLLSLFLLFLPPFSSAPDSIFLTWFSLGIIQTAIISLYHRLYRKPAAAEKAEAEREEEAPAAQDEVQQQQA